MDGGGKDFGPVDSIPSRTDFLAVDLVRPHRGAEEAFGGIVETGEREKSLVTVQTGFNQNTLSILVSC